MGVLAVWTARARDLVPHLTAQSTSARGFQLLLEFFRLWERFAAMHAEHSERVSDFFLVTEQVFARAVGRETRDWPLPGRRRVRARNEDTPAVSIEDRGWHLLNRQLGNGLWGLYRGAAYRAGLLDDTLERLDADVLEFADEHPVVRPGRSEAMLFELVEQAMASQTAPMRPEHVTPLIDDVMRGWREMPMAEVMWQRIVEANELTTVLARLLLETAGDDVDHRHILRQARRLLPEKADLIEDAIRCEDLVSILESIFDLLCAVAADRPTISEAAARLEVNGLAIGDNLSTAGLTFDLGRLEDARQAFFETGVYDGVASARHRRFASDLQTDSTVAVVKSVLSLHEWVANSRGRALWVWLDEHGRLVSDVDPGMPRPEDLQPGVSWRNDYFLSSLRSVARELDEVRV